MVVVSKLGLDQFDSDDLRLLEVLAGHAAVALVNARLFEAQRREAEIAKALLGFGREPSSMEGLDVIFERVAEGSARLLAADHASVWLQRDQDDDLGCLAVWAADEERRANFIGLTPPFDLIRPFTICPTRS